MRRKQLRQEGNLTCPACRRTVDQLRQIIPDSAEKGLCGDCQSIALDTMRSMLDFMRLHHWSIGRTKAGAWYISGPATTAGSYIIAIGETATQAFDKACASKG